MFNFLPIIGGAFSAMNIDNETNQTVDALQREAQLAERNAQIAIEAGQYNARRQQAQANQIFGSMKTDIGASGTESSGAGVLDILRQSHVNAEIDRLGIIHESQMTAMNYRLKGQGLEEDAKAVRKASGNRKVAALLGGFSQAASNGMMSGGADADPTPKYNSTGGYGSAGGSYSDRSNYA